VPVLVAMAVYRCMKYTNKAHENVPSLLEMMLQGLGTLPAPWGFLISDAVGAMLFCGLAMQISSWTRMYTNKKPQAHSCTRTCTHTYTCTNLHTSFICLLQEYIDGLEGNFGLGL
jgi:hypothetical protein